jgi:hypothetical protein
MLLLLLLLLCRFVMSHTIEENVLAVATARRVAMDLTTTAAGGGGGGGGSRRGAGPGATADAAALSLADVANLISTSRWR